MQISDKTLEFLISLGPDHIDHTITISELTALLSEKDLIPPTSEAKDIITKLRDKELLTVEHNFDEDEISLTLRKPQIEQFLKTRELIDEKTPHSTKNKQENAYKKANKYIRTKQLSSLPLLEKCQLCGGYGAQTFIPDISQHLRINRLCKSCRGNNDRSEIIQRNIKPINLASLALDMDSFTDRTLGQNRSKRSRFTKQYKSRLSLKCQLCGTSDYEVQIDKVPTNPNRPYEVFLFCRPCKHEYHNNKLDFKPVPKNLYTLIGLNFKGTKNDKLNISYDPVHKDVFSEVISKIKQKMSGLKCQLCERDISSVEKMHLINRNGEFFAICDSEDLEEFEIYADMGQISGIYI